MLALDRKKTEKVEIGKPLEQYIRSHYTADDLQDYQEAINNVQKLREDFRNISDKNEATRELATRYYATVLSLEQRFPIQENQVRISFPWFDSLKNKKNALFSIHYEKASVMYNIAAIMSQIGTQQNRQSKDGLKVASQNYQMAAGAFAELKDELERHPQTGVVDLTTDFVNASLQLMLAQAQECFFDRAMKDGMNPQIVAKLAQSAAELYETTLTLINNPTIAASVPKSWVPYIQVKATFARSAAQFLQAQHHGKAEEYGPQVARYQAANALIEDLKKKGTLKSVNSELQSLIASFQGDIQKGLLQAEKENDTIYHDIVPALGKLSSIEAKTMVKPTPFTETAKFPVEKDPFGKLIPYYITEKLSVYSEKKDTLMRGLSRQIDENNQLAIATLSSLNLPGAIEALETNKTGGIPPSMQEKINNFRKEGGIKLVLELQETLKKLAEEDENILTLSLKKLDDEETEDGQMRQQYGSRWFRTPSHTLTLNLRQDAAKYKGHVDHARKSNDIVHKKFQEYQQYLLKMSGTQDELLSLIPSPSNSSSAIGSNDSTVVALKQSLSALDKLIAERSQLKEALIKTHQTDDISAKLLQAHQVNTPDEQVFGEELAKYDKINEALTASFATQNKLLGAIQQQNIQFVAAKQSQSQGLEAQREQVFQGLNNALKISTELKSNFREGIQFYSNFQDMLKQFLTKCTDFSLARNTEKTDLVNDLLSQGQQQQQTTTVPQVNPFLQSPPPQQQFVNLQPKPTTTAPPQYQNPQHQNPQQPLVQIPTTQSYGTQVQQQPTVYQQQQPQVQQQQYQPQYQPQVYQQQPQVQQQQYFTQQPQVQQQQQVQPQMYVNPQQYGYVQQQQPQYYQGQPMPPQGYTYPPQQGYTVQPPQYYTQPKK